MSIRVQQTPNPNARKYVLPDRQFLQSMNYATAEAASEHPIAAQLFALDGVYNVFMAQDFITVNKLPETDWDDLEIRIRDVIEHGWDEPEMGPRAENG